MAAITHYAGKHQIYRWECANYLNTEIDPTGATAISFTIKSADTDEDATIVLEKTLADGIDIVERTNGVVTEGGTPGIEVELDAEGDDTDEMAEGDYVFDLQVVTSSGRNIVIEKDIFTIDYAVKRATPA